MEEFLAVYTAVLILARLGGVGGWVGGLTVIIGLISVPIGIELELIGTELGNKKVA